MGEVTEGYIEFLIRIDRRSRRVEFDDFRGPRVVRCSRSADRSLEFGDQDGLRVACAKGIADQREGAALLGAGVRRAAVERVDRLTVCWSS